MAPGCSPSVRLLHLQIALRLVAREEERALNATTISRRGRRDTAGAARLPVPACLPVPAPACLPVPAWVAPACWGGMHVGNLPQHPAAIAHCASLLGGSAGPPPTYDLVLEMPAPDATFEDLCGSMLDERVFSKVWVMPELGF